MERKFYKLRIDAVFKTVFNQKNGSKYLERLLYECLGEKVKIKSFKLPELVKDNVKVKTKILDVVVDLDNEEVNIEINSCTSDYIKRRNACYIFKLYSDSISSLENYDNMKKFVQINLTSGLNNNYPVKAIYTLSDVENKLNFIDNLEIYEFNIGKIKSKCYNEFEGTILSIMDMDYEELNNLKGDKLIMEIKDKVIDLNNDEKFVGFMSAEEEEKIWINTYKSVARREGLAEGRAEGRAEGKIEGKTEGYMEIAKRMLELSYDLNEISKVTGLSLKEIEKLK